MKQKSRCLFPVILAEAGIHVPASGLAFGDGFLPAQE
jgi:hypothetical protein